MLFHSSHNVVFKTIPGAPPDLLLLNEYDETLEKFDISGWSREECNQFLLKKGFFKKTTQMEEVPEPHKSGPYTQHTEDL